tara:strand:- start:1349 stop:1474 length:126 start_codon:yes stop_codon:yes gene_type:complete
MLFSLEKKRIKKGREYTRKTQAKIKEGTKKNIEAKVDNGKR